MSSTALYKAFIEVGASQEAATEAAEDVIQVSQLPQLATKADIAILESKIAANIANQETRLVRWMVGCAFFFAGIVITGVGIVIQIMLSPGVAQ